MPLNHNSVTFIAFDFLMYYTLICKISYLSIRRRKS